MKFIARLAAVTLLVAPFSWGQAQETLLLEGVEQSKIDAARAGDPYAAYDIALPFTGSANMSLNEDTLRAAIKYFRIAYDGFLAKDNEERRYATYAARELGANLWQLSELAEALEWSDQCIRLAAEYWDFEDAIINRALCLEDKAITLQALSRNQESIGYLGEARSIYRTLGPEFKASVANTLLNEGVGLDGMKRYREAIGVYEDALEGFAEVYGNDHVTVAYVANNIGVIYWRLKEPESAIDWLNRALPVLEREEGRYSVNVAKVFINLGLAAYDLERYNEAIREGMKAMPFIAMNRSQSLADQRWLFELFSRAHAKLGDREKAIFFGKMAVNAQQQIRALNASLSDSDTEELRAEWRRLYRDLADLLIAEGRISEAQAVLNMEKEEEVFEFLQRDGQADLTETRAILNNTELDYEAKLAQLAQIPVQAERALAEIDARIDSGTATDEDEAQIDALLDALDLAQMQFEAAVDDFLTQVSDEARQGLEAQFSAVGAYQDVLSDLERPTAILQIAALDDKVHLFLTLPEATTHAEVVIPREEVARMVFDALQGLEARDAGIEEVMNGLYKVLFGPVEGTLSAAGTEVIMLNLDGFLRYVPFAALHDGHGYLVERFAFAQYSTVTQTQFARASRDADKAAGFGVTKAHSGFDPLPGVAREIETIFTAGDGQGVLGGNAALDEGFDSNALRRTLRGKPEILHIASHFALRPGQVDDSFLLMGDGTHLSLADIRSKRAFRFQGVDLLTLSACQTARGGDGSEIDGFGATAQLNGASAVMASLWPVADAATPILMRDFYRGMMQDDLDKAEALRRAQVAMLRGVEVAEIGPSRAAASLDEDTPEKSTFAHPYFWSAFVLMGNWL